MPWWGVVDWLWLFIALSCRLYTLFVWSISPHMVQYKNLSFDVVQGEKFLPKSVNYFRRKRGSAELPWKQSTRGRISGLTLNQMMDDVVCYGLYLINLNDKKKTHLKSFFLWKQYFVHSIKVKSSSCVPLCMKSPIWETEYLHWLSKADSLVFSTILCQSTISIDIHVFCILYMLFLY